MSRRHSYSMLTRLREGNTSHVQNLKADKEKEPRSGSFSLWKNCGLRLLLLLCCSLLCCFLCLLLCCHSSEVLEAYKILCFDHKASKDASVPEKYFTFTNEHSYLILSLAYLTCSIHKNIKLWITRV